MCIAIYQPANKTIDHDTLKRCAIANPDGCGLAYINEDGGLDILTAMGFDNFYQMYQECLEESPDSPMLIHFRIATHGTISLDNCHPFFIEDGEDTKVFMHNGTISPLTQYVNKNTGHSDTVEFGLRILEQLPQGWMTNPAIKSLIEEYIGWSKIVVMDECGNVEIYNEHKGEWDDGIWYSNSSYKKKEPLKIVDRRSHDYYYIWIEGQRNRWDSVEKKYKPCDITGNFIKESPYCEFCNTYGSDSVTATTESITYNLCRSCFRELKEIGILFTEVHVVNG